MHAGWREGHEAGSETGAGSLAPLGRLGVGEGEEGWGRGGVVIATAGEGGAGIKDVGWCFPALCSAGWGPPF